MVLFPNAKINIGLNIINKREDGFHNLETLFYPIQLSDILEINPSDDFQFTQTGLSLNCDIEKNLVVKAYRLLEQAYSLPPVSIHLHKIIPFGAGLGGGSSDAAFTLIGLNNLFNLTIDTDELIKYASILGSDCAFFIQNKPSIGTGKGNVLKQFDLPFPFNKLVLVKPNISVSTAEAYSKVKPMMPIVPLEELILKPVGQWREFIFNQFEESVFVKHKEIAAIKELLYEKGATYAAMSGSGSAVFGLFETEPGDLKDSFRDCFVWEEFYNEEIQ